MITFAEAIPGKAFQRVLERADSSFRNAGLEGISGVGARGGAAVGFQVDLSTGKTTSISGPPPAIFSTADRATQFIVTPNSLTARTARYIRWEPFAGQIEELVLPLVDLYAEIAAIQHVQVDYVDRFLWSGSWDNFEWRELLRDDGNFVPGKLAGVRGPWHCHSGWIEAVDGGQRLINVNIDLGDFARSGGISVPSVGILTLMRDDVIGTLPGPTPRYEDGASVQVGLEELHNDLKTLFAQIIVDAMAERIGLMSP